ncbi:MAG: DUF2846 domain-containing protein [Candidatus Sulfotelmatobacter sp.]
MEAALVVILLAFSAYAQETPAAPHWQAACGPIGVNFDTEASTAQPPAQPDPGKALVFVAEDFTQVQAGVGSPRIKVALDGTWIGATHGKSFLFFQVAPGEHHLCIKWQSGLERFSKLASFAHLTADPGKTYYFRSRITFSSQWATEYLDLDALDPDEGQYMVATSSLVASHAKK